MQMRRAPGLRMCNRRVERAARGLPSRWAHAWIPLLSRPSVGLCRWFRAPASGFYNGRRERKKSNSRNPVSSEKPGFCCSLQDAVSWRAKTCYDPAMLQRSAFRARWITLPPLITFLALPLVAGSRSSTFLVKPYLQLPTPSSIRVMWETDRELPGEVEYGTTRDLGQALRVGIPTQLHELCLHDLKPGATYFYRVRSGDLVSEMYSFRTAPPLGIKHWRMALYGDSRSNPTMHAKVAAQIAKAKVDLIVHTGDIVTNGKDHDSWRRQFFEPLGTLGHSVPWVSTIGNHERDADNYFSYMALPGNEHYFGFDFANAQIICLDSNAWIEKGRDSKQYAWLKEHLARKRAATWTFVVFHHPLFSAHATRPINPLRWDWAPLFLDPGNRVDGVLTGHDHFYARNSRMGRVANKPQPGVLFLTSAGGGAGLYRTKQRDYVAKENSTHHFTLFEFDGDRVRLSAIDVGGQV